MSNFQSWITVAHTIARAPLTACLLQCCTPHRIDVEGLAWSASLVLCNSSLLGLNLTLIVLICDRAAEEVRRQASLLESGGTSEQEGLQHIWDAIEKVLHRDLSSQELQVNQQYSLQPHLKVHQPSSIDSLLALEHVLGAHLN